MNLFDNIPQSLPQELIEVLAEGKGVTIERIVSRGHVTPEAEWYDQDRDEWVVLLTGAASLKIEGKQELIQLSPGDALHLPAHLRHRVEWTDPDQDSLWIAVHFTPIN
ncbi:cupin domain-containing protein [Endozoicomonas euniceicola]|uniref:Cupin domain-containing protein n=1 Tax=Endozoicomonas euniceicola TaxID=1234143 RepID=A0ABY6GS11_9GAMM|nr:cupin domain-containing protein [Endozoicomonas euniceicola]UYM15537.1 cupin domain-containing protein [Endozoicomonas euniceicola]